MKWPLIEHHTLIPKNEFIEATKFVLYILQIIKYSMIKFTSRLWSSQQSYGFTSLSQVTVLTLQSLETLILSELTFTPSFYVKYIALSALHNSLDELLHKFKSFHTKLKFTMEVGVES